MSALCNSLHEMLEERWRPEPGGATLTELPLIFKGGTRHNETADWPTRFVGSLTFGVHDLPRQSFYETYSRTIELDLATGRTIFQCVATEFRVNRAPSWYRRLLVWAGLMQPRIAVIE